MTKLIPFTRYPDKTVYVVPDAITYITSNDIGPAKTRIYFNGDRANCLDVMEEIEEVANRIYINNNSYIVSLSNTDEIYGNQ